MSDLKLKNIVKKYGKNRVVDGLDLDVKDGELVTLLGPSGCGKTTTLRCITGFLNPDEGSISIGDRDITEIPPEMRGIGLVFQNYALWPHMTVFENLAFGLKLKKMTKDNIRKKVNEGLSIVKLEGYEDRFPRQLSGGQQQRVALARAIVLEPDILLLDEPLSNLDAQLREQMRFEIGQIHSRYNITTVYVTHDQTEAMVISDKIVILNKGRILQKGTPSEIYGNPANKFVAEFIGTTSFIPGEITSFNGEDVILKLEGGFELKGHCQRSEIGLQAEAALRPENISFCSASEKGDNIFQVKVGRVSYTGDAYDYELDLQGYPIRARGQTNQRHEVGENVTIHVTPDATPVLLK